MTEDSIGYIEIIEGQIIELEYGIPQIPKKERKEKCGLMKIWKGIKHLEN